MIIIKWNNSNLKPQTECNTIPMVLKISNTICLLRCSQSYNNNHHPSVDMCPIHYVQFSLIFQFYEPGDDRLEPIFKHVILCDIMKLNPSRWFNKGWLRKKKKRGESHINVKSDVKRTKKSRSSIREMVTDSIERCKTSQKRKTKKKFVTFFTFALCTFIIHSRNLNNL